MKRSSNYFRSRRFIVTAICAFTFVGVCIYLRYVDQLKQITEYLDSEKLSIHLGGFRYSVYNVLKGSIVILGVFWVARMLVHFIELRVQSLRKVNPGNQAVLATVLTIFVYILAFFVGTSLIGINVTAFTVLGGTIGIGIGFGLKNITSNFISGLVLLFEKSLEPGDLIQLESPEGPVLGKVKKTRARYTLIETLKGREIMVPNENLLVNQVTNLSYSDSKGRVDILVGVAYDSDMEHVRNILLECAHEHPRALQDPEPNCFMTEFADSSVNFLLLFWIEDVTFRGREPKSDVMRKIFARFKEENITIPYPQRDVHLISESNNGKIA